MATKAKKEDEGDFFKNLKEKYNAYFVPEKIKTNILPLDLVLNGSLQSGSLIELAGESQCGKSTLVLNLAKNLAEKGYRTLYIDAEGSVKEDMLRGIGLEPYLITEKNQENKFVRVCEARYSRVEEIINGALESRKFKLIVIDSLTALGNDDYIDTGSEKNAVDTRIGMDAQLASRFLKKLSALKTDYNVIFIVINQTRVDLSKTFMPTHTSTGGQAVKFYPDIRLFMRLTGKITKKVDLVIGEQEVPVGATGTIEARKSRVGAGFIPFPFTIYYGQGVADVFTYIDILGNIKNGDKPTLEQITKMTYELHLPSGEYKSTSGANAMQEMVIEHFKEVKEIVDNYLEDYYGKVEHNELTSKDETFKAVERSGVSLDDTVVGIEYEI